MIHTDFERGFIRAEVILRDDFVAWQGGRAPRSRGQDASRGKEYVVRDGDVIHFRFNVQPLAGCGLRSVAPIALNPASVSRKICDPTSSIRSFEISPA